MFNVIEIATAWKLDLVIRKARPFSIEELRRRETVTMLGTTVATATAEDTIIAKLEWAKAAGSERQLEDVAGILRVRAGAVDLGSMSSGWRRSGSWLRECRLSHVTPARFRIFDRGCCNAAVYHLLVPSPRM